MKAAIEGDLNPVPLGDLPRQSRTDGLNSTDEHTGGPVGGGSGSGGGKPFLAGVGAVTVSRSGVGSEGGYTWTITFDSAVGDLPQASAARMRGWAFARRPTTFLINDSSTIVQSLLNLMLALYSFRLRLRFRFRFLSFFLGRFPPGSWR